ncbi:MAG TPA: hypothetical protein DHV84_05470 [Desulfotomaculum sp.]|nr:hypothetical protein [Desulfotomaculum sp.]
MSRRFLSLMTVIVCFVFVLSLGISTGVNFGEAAPKASLTKIESSDKKAVIKCPKGTFVVKENQLIENEVPTIVTEVYFSQTYNYDPYANHTFASDIFKISVLDKVYRLSEQGELTLTYSKSISKVVADRLSVWYSEEKVFDGCKPKENCLGGYVNAGKNTVTVPFQIKGKDIYYAVFLDQREPGFRDDWSYSCVMPLWSKEIMDTVNQGIYEEIERREFAFMMVRGLGLPIVEVNIENTFFDIKSDDIYFKFIETAARYGIINGFPPKQGETKPGFEHNKDGNEVKNLTREQAAAIIARVANLKIQTDVDKVQKDLEKIFPVDGENISPWAAPAVLAVYKAKFMGGDKNDQGEVFRPGDPLKRSEAAKITYLLLKKLKKI